jgi:glycosyltransferase involved in cell wall biosynthesis
MKLLYVSKALVVAAYRDKVRELARHADVVAVIPERWRPHPEPVRNGEVLPWPVWLPGRPHFHLYHGVRGLLDRVRPDLVHIDEEPYSAVTWQLVRACRARRLPALFFTWQSIPKALPPPFAAMRSHVFHSVAGAIAGTERAGQGLRQLGYAGPLQVVPQFGVDVTRFAPRPDLRAERRAALGIGDGEFVVGFAGRLVPEKGGAVLVDALHDLPAARLVVAGEGPERRRLERAARAQLNGRVRFEPWQGSLAMPAWLSALDALAVPSLTTRGWEEQFGRILIEAMACGVPVVGSDSGEIPRVIGPAGLVVPEGDARALADALTRLSHDPALRARLAAAGRNRVLAEFTNARVVERTVAFYRELTTGRHLPARTPR